MKQQVLFHKTKKHDAIVVPIQETNLIIGSKYRARYLVLFVLLILTMSPQGLSGSMCPVELKDVLTNTFSCSHKIL